MVDFYYVYVLVSSIDGSRYIGFTGNLERRLLEHNSGATKHLISKLPVKLFYYEAYLDKTQARKREYQLKKSSWHKKQLFDRIFPLGD